MPKVKFIAAKGVDLVRVDDVELEKGGDAVSVTDDQLKRLQALEGHKFSVGEKQGASNESKE